MAKMTPAQKAQNVFPNDPIRQKEFLTGVLTVIRKWKFHQEYLTLAERMGISWARSQQ